MKHYPIDHPDACATVRHAGPQHSLLFTIDPAEVNCKFCRARAMLNAPYPGRDAPEADVSDWAATVLEGKRLLDSDPGLPDWEAELIAERPDRWSGGGPRPRKFKPYLPRTSPGVL